MLQIIAALLSWLPRISDWALGPAVALLLLLALMPALRPRATFGLIVVAAVGALLLSVGLIAIVGGYGNIILHVFQEFGPLETVSFVTTLFPGIGSQLASLVSTIATTAVASGAVVVLRRGARRGQPGRIAAA